MAVREGGGGSGTGEPWSQVGAVILTVGVIALICLGTWVITPNVEWDHLKYFVAVLATVSITAFGLIVAIRLFIPVLFPGSPAGIDLGCLLSSEKGPDGKCGPASVGKFQLLVFTVVIAYGFVLILVHNLNPGTTIPTPRPDGWPWPQIPNGVLTLLGLSGGTHLVGQGVTNSLRSEKSRLAAELMKGATSRSSDEIIRVLNSF